MSATCVNLCLRHSEATLISIFSFYAADSGSKLQFFEVERSFRLDISRDVVYIWEG